MAMETAALPRATLTDLLDRVLDRGLVINADIIISLAGVPLIGINLRAALAGMETMLKYGLMQEWDRRIRAPEAGITDPAIRGLTTPALDFHRNGQRTDRSVTD